MEVLRVVHEPSRQVPILDPSSCHHPPSDGGRPPPAVEGDTLGAHAGGSSRGDSGTSSTSGDRRGRRATRLPSGVASSGGGSGRPASPRRTSRTTSSSTPGPPGTSASPRRLDGPTPSAPVSGSPNVHREGLSVPPWSEVHTSPESPDPQKAPREGAPSSTPRSLHGSDPHTPVPPRTSQDPPVV